jgi:glycosyltransferase involved in cell wall biosynthesis
MKRLRILISAYACEPCLGSEQGVGWNFVQQIASSNEVWAITRFANAKTIEPYIKQNEGPRVNWVYFDLPWWVPFSKRSDKLEFIYYYLWQVAILFVARRLHRQEHFELAHHVTFGTYWIPSFISLLPIPFIWGPVGGGEAAPSSFLSTFSFRGKVYEYIRYIIHWFGEKDPFVLLTARKSRAILATSIETKVRIDKLASDKCIVISQVSVTDAEFSMLSVTPLKQERPFRIISAGGLIHRKAYHLGLEAFAMFQLHNRDSEYWLFGDGPEKRYLSSLCQKLEIEKNVKFFGKVPRNEVLQNLVHGDVFLHPCLHESGGYVIAEALAAGRPVICLDLGGPALQVNELNGFKISAQSPDYIREQIASALELLASDAKLRQRMYHGAINGVRTNQLWSKKGSMISSIYQQILFTDTQEIS